MTPTRKPYGWVFCPMDLFPRIQLDDDVRDALFDAGRATHRARAPAAVELRRPLVDRRLAHVERVDVEVLHLSVRDRALDELLQDGRAALRRELQELDRLGGVFPADQVGDHACLP